jgi:hypothetical protein
MGFELLCVTMIALLFGAAVCFAGYRLFLALLPIWGFFVGFALGAQTLQALFGMGFLATTTSWVVGFIVGALFAVLSYLFYTVAIAMAAGSLGYALGAGLMHLIGLNLGLIVWLVGIAVAIVLVVLTFVLNLQKWVLVVATAIGGAGAVVLTLMFGPAGASLARFVENPVRLALQDSPLWAILFVILAIGGIVVQMASSRSYQLEPYANRI